MSLAHRLSAGRIMPMWQNLDWVLPSTRTLVIALTLSLTGLVPVLPVPMASVHAAAPDYGKGFDLLFELGLPDLSGPEWQYVAFDTGRNEEDFNNPYFNEALKAGTKEFRSALSHGWLEKKNESAPASSSTVIATNASAGTGTVQHKHFQRLNVNGWQFQGIAEDRSDWAELQQAGLAYSPLKPGKDTADEKADAKALAMGLQAFAGADENVKRSILYNTDFFATCLFRAAQHHRRGHKEEAAAVAQALFEIAPRKDRLIDLAVQVLADHQYQAAIQQFRQSADWKALDAELNRLLTTYTRGWMERPLVEKLHRLVKPRAASPSAPPLAQASLLTPEQQAWWQQMANPAPAPKPDTGASPGEAAQSGQKQEPDTAEDEEGGVAQVASSEASMQADLSQVAQAWLTHVKMQVNPSNLAMWKEQVASDPLMLAVFTREWDWITVAAAAVGDETLLPMRSLPYSNRNSFDFTSDPPEFSDEELEEMWKNMSRPRTRGDLAASFLAAVLPRDDKESDGLPADPAELRQVALDAAKALKGKAPLDFARFYLHHGTGDQKSQAMMAVVNLGDAGDLKEVEALILEQPSQHFEQAGLVVHKLKTTSKPFLDQFRKALLKEQNDDSGGDPLASGNALPEYLKEQFNALETLASGRGPKELLADFTQGKLGGAAFYRQLQTLIKSPEEGHELADLALDNATTLPKDQADRKMQLLMFSMNYAQELTEPRKALLRKLLASDADATVLSFEGSVEPLSHYVYWAADQLAHGDELRHVQQRLQAMDNTELWPLRIARGRAVLEGSPMPPLPSASRVSADRRKAMVQALDEHLDQGWSEYVQALSMDEKLALAEELRKAEFKPGWRGPALRIVKVQIHPQDLMPLEGVAGLQGQPVNAASLAKLGEACRTRLGTLGEGQGLHVTVIPLVLHQGLRILIARGSAEDENDYGRSMMVQAGQWMKQLRSSNPEPVPINGYGWARWMQGAREMGVANWHLDKDNKWHNWPESENEPFGSAPNYGTVVPEAELIRSLEERIATWEPKSGLFWFETGAVKPAAPDKKD